MALESWGSPKHPFNSQDPEKQDGDCVPSGTCLCCAPPISYTMVRLQMVIKEVSSGLVTTLNCQIIPYTHTSICPWTLCLPIISLLLWCPNLKPASVIDRPRLYGPGHCKSFLGMSKDWEALILRFPPPISHIQCSPRTQELYPSAWLANPTHILIQSPGVP
jgi:hypothetical protein